VLRHGVRLVILDPWNELEHKMRQGENETFYIGRALRAIKRFAKVYDVAFWIVAHPTKPFEGKVRMPRCSISQARRTGRTRPTSG
jgi:twinkle protein